MKIETFLSLSVHDAIEWLPYHNENDGIIGGLITNLHNSQFDDEIGDITDNLRNRTVLELIDNDLNCGVTVVTIQQVLNMVNDGVKYD